MWVFTRKKALVFFGSMIVSSIIGIFVFAPDVQALQTTSGMTCNPMIKIGNDYFDHLVYAVGPGGTATLTQDTVVYNAIFFFV